MRDVGSDSLGERGIEVGDVSDVWISDVGDGVE
jgi:hypothetical protein